MASEFSFSRPGSSVSSRGDLLGARPAGSPYSIGRSRPATTPSVQTRSIPAPLAAGAKPNPQSHLPAKKETTTRSIWWAFLLTAFEAALSALGRVLFGFFSTPIFQR